MKKLLVLSICLLITFSCYAAVSYTGTEFGTADVTFSWDLTNYGKAKLNFTPTSIMLTDEYEVDHENDDIYLYGKSDNPLTFEYDISSFSPVQLEIYAQNPLSSTEGGAIGWSFNFNVNNKYYEGHSSNFKTKVEEKRVSFSTGTGSTGTGLKKYSAKFNIDIETESLIDAVLAGPGVYRSYIVVAVTSEKTGGENQ